MPSQQQRHHCVRTHTQTGAVLIIVLIMLALLSMTAATSMRNAQSTEAISGSTRNAELASQAAEIALWHCEESVKKRMAMEHGFAESKAARYVTTLTYAHIAPFERQPTDKPPAWQYAKGNWDTPSQYVFVLPLDLLGMASLYKRAPECLVESLTETPKYHFIITARGFGPDVAATGTKGSRPLGTEVWLQTHIILAEDFQTLKSRSWRQIFLRQ
jgi:Tfp pilus assembly protein PilX